MARTRKYYLKNNYLNLRSKIKVPRRSLRYVTHHLMVMHVRTIFQWTVLLDLFEFDLEVKGQGPTKVITVRDTPPYGHAPTYQILTYLKSNNYLTLRSKVKVPQRSLWYVTHRLMVMHPHIQYHWPISKDKNVMARTRKNYLKNKYLTLRSKVKVQRKSLRYATHCLMVMHPHTKCHWPILKETIILPWGQRSRSHEGHYGMRHTALWSCTHIPNIIEEEEEEKKKKKKEEEEEEEEEEEGEEEEIRLKQYVSLWSKGRRN